MYVLYCHVLLCVGYLIKLSNPLWGVYHCYRYSHLKVSKWNEWEFRGHLCAHTGQIGPGEPPEDGEMNEMILPHRHRIRNSNPGDLRTSTLPLGHGGSPQYWVLRVDGEEHICFFQTAETRKRTPNSSVKGSGANHYPSAPAPKWL